MNKPIIALDYSDFKEAKKLLKQFDEPLFVKVGMELFYSEGPKVVKDLHSMGHDVFLDLKLYDIPNTVGRAMSAIGKMNVKLTNVHVAGGTAMMKRAVESFKDENPDGLVVGVTQVTSMSEHVVLEEQKSALGLADSILHYAELARDAGLDGVVSSPLEAEMIHEACGSNFLTVTPGIRLKDESYDDQVRVVTPNLAKDLGTNYIVVGRSITGSSNPARTYGIVKTLWETGGSDE